MGLASVIRNAVAVADKVTQDLQPLVRLQHVLSSNSSGAISSVFASPWRLIMVARRDWL